MRRRQKQEIVDGILARSGGYKARIGASKNTLKQSRHTGILFGKPAPRFTKCGRSARYKLSKLIEFRDQFPEYNNTSEY
jgi:hypothetical protein